MFQKNTFTELRDSQTTPHLCKNMPLTLKARVLIEEYSVAETFQISQLVEVQCIRKFLLQIICYLIIFVHLSLCSDTNDANGALDVYSSRLEKKYNSIGFLFEKSAYKIWNSSNN